MRGPQRPEDLDLRAYFPLAQKWAAKYRRSFGYDDAFAIALTGLVVAQKKWRPARGPFGACAPYWIRYELNGALHRKQLQEGHVFADTTLGRAYGRAGKLTRHQRQRASTMLVPIDAAVPGTKDMSFADIIADTAHEPRADAIQSTEAEHLHKRLSDALATLPKRERDIVVAHAAGETLEVLGARWGVSRERVRQVNNKALATLRKAMTGKPPARRPVEAASRPSVPPKPPVQPRKAKAMQRHAPPRPREWVKDGAGRWQAVAWV